METLVILYYIVLYCITDDISFSSDHVCLLKDIWYNWTNNCIFFEISFTVDVTRTEAINLVVMLRYSSIIVVIIPYKKVQGSR